MAWKETNAATDVAGEAFASDLAEGYKCSAKDSSPFRRSLAHMKERDAKLKAMRPSDYESYDETNTVNNS